MEEVGDAGAGLRHGGLILLGPMARPGEFAQCSGIWVAFVSTCAVEHSDGLEIGGVSMSG